MDNKESASLCEIAFQALLELPRGSYSRIALQLPMDMVRDEIARLRHRTPEDIQNEFEGKAGQTKC